MIRLEKWKNTCKIGVIRDIIVRRTKWNYKYTVCSWYGINSISLKWSLRLKFWEEHWKLFWELFWEHEKQCQENHVRKGDDFRYTVIAVARTMDFLEVVTLPYIYHKPYIKLSSTALKLYFATTKNQINKCQIITNNSTEGTQEIIVFEKVLHYFSIIYLKYL